MKKRRITSLFLCIAMMFTVLTFSKASAAEYCTVEGSFVTQNTDNKTTSKPASVIFTDENGKEYTGSISENGKSGTYTANIPAGIYDITISKPGYLSYTVSGVRTGNRNIRIPELAILPGDLNIDGRIDTKDLAVFIRGFNTDERYADIRKIADFDEDGILSVTDIGYLKPNYDSSKENYEWTNVMRLKTDYRDDPLGIDMKEPEFNWAMESTKRGEKQTAYRIGVASTYEKAVNGEFDIWDSGKVESTETRAVYGELTEADGKAPEELLGQTRYFWTVSSFNADGKEIPASQIAEFETALFGDFGDNNKWITLGDSKSEGVPYCELSEGTIELNLTCTTKGMGFWFWTNNDDTQRHMWYFQLDGTLYNEGKDCLVPDYNTDGDKWNIGTPVDLSEFGLALGTPFNVRIEIADGVSKTYVNGTHVLDYSLKGTNNAIGKVALRLSGTEMGTINSLVIKDKNGEVYYTSDGVEAEDSQYSEATELAAVYFRKQFTLEQSADNIAKARLYSTAAGNQIMYLNGKRASDDYMAPGKSQYTTLLYYQTYDVTDLIQNGENTVAAEVGQGWYNAGSPHATYGTNVGLRAKLIITYSDGTDQTIDTDSTWLSTNEGPNYHNRYYDGQKVDARKKIEGWNENGNTSDKWVQVKATDSFATNGDLVMTDNLLAENMNPVRNICTLNPVSVTKYGEKDYIYEFEQNIVGTSRITAKAPAGTKIMLYYAETLKNGNCVDRNNTTYNNHNGVDEYIFRGDEKGETVEFDLVYHGFKYIEIKGLSEPLPLDCIEGLVISSDLDRTGYFDSSNDTLDKFMENIVWTMRGNFVSTITDCPTREKNTWTGDSHLFAHTGAYFSNVFNHYRNFAGFVRNSQYTDGAVSEIVPLKTKPTTASSSKAKTPSGWSDSVIMIPWEIYNQYGDVTILEENYHAMTEWIRFLVEKKIYRKGDTSKTLPYYIDPEKADFIRVDGNYGDHLGYYSYNSDIGYRENEFGTTMYVYYETSFSEVATAYSAYSCGVLAEIATILGKDEDAAYYYELYQNLAEGWRNNFLKEDGYTAVSGGKTTKTTVDGVDVYTYNSDIKRIYGDKEYDNLGSQTSYCLGLYLDLYETPEKKAKAAENLAKIVEYENYTMTAGFPGIDFFYHVLSDNGYFDVAMRVMENEDPDGFSLLSHIKQGATTVWEGYNSEKSQSHNMFGSTARWIFSKVLGIGNNHVRGNAGYNHFELNPIHPTYEGTKVNWVKGSFDTVNGIIKSEWNYDREANVFKYNCTVPANTSATLSLPVIAEHTVITEGKKDISQSEGVEFIEEKNGRRYYEITSGVYEFTVMDWADYNNTDYSLDYEDISEDYYFQGRWIDMEKDSVPVKVSINAGTEIHFKVSGTENVWLKLNSPTYREPYIAVSVDGAEPVRMITPKKGNMLIASRLSYGEHTVRIIVDATPPYEQKKWTSGDGFTFECAVVDEGGTISGIKPKNKVIAYFGDSITEGNAVYKGGSPNPADSSHIQSYAFYTSTLLDCISYTSGFSGSGVTKGGGGETPKCINYIDYLMNGVPFDMPTPDVIVFNHGANDPMVSTANVSNFVKEYSACLDRLREKFPDTPIVCVQVFSGNNKGYNEIQQAIGDRENVYFIPTTGWCFTSLDTVHPDAVCAGAIGNSLAEALKQVLSYNFFN